jgi:hypothetical protein
VRRERFHASKIGQSQQGHLEREAPFADKRSASQFGLIALVGAVGDDCTADNDLLRGLPTARSDHRISKMC